MMLGKIEGRRWDGWMTSLLQWIWVWANSGSWWWAGKPVVLQSMELQSQTWWSDLTVFLSNLRKIVFTHIILTKRTHVLRTWIWLSVSVEMHILVIIQLLEDWPPVLHFFLLLVTVKHTQGENSQRMYTSTS